MLTNPIQWLLDWSQVHPWTASLILVGIAAAWSLLIQHLTVTLNAGRYAWQRRLRARLGIAEGANIQELRWLPPLVQLMLWPTLGFLLLHVWGQHEFGENVWAAFAGKGFKIGSVTLVPIKVVLGLIWFGLLVTFTRWLKGRLQDDWLPLWNVEPSLRVSVATLFGYLTFAIALLVGLNVAGVNLGKLAIVAGALSVGIGFGLQNIFNNFISGIILLFERPVRLGDYIKVAGTEGFVRRVRIRSTELETHDRTTVIVPNSQLISSEVENWTYADSLGRIVIAVSVGYQSDPEQVKAVLLECSEARPELLRGADADLSNVPQPFVVLKNFGADGLEFELRAYVRDTNTRLGTSSALRFAILAQFRALGIEIPFAQRDVWLRNPEALLAAKPQAEYTPRPDANVA